MNAEHANVVERAKAMAVAMHDGCGHTRSNGEPYWRHPERVVQTLVAHHRHAATLAAAWLHDVPEDCPADVAGCETLLTLIAADFGADVGELVREVTNFFGPSATMEEKQARLREHARHMSGEAKWIKLADRWDNISGMVGWPDSKRQRYAKATIELLDALEPLPAGAAALAAMIGERARSIAGGTAGRG